MSKRLTVSLSKPVLQVRRVETGMKLVYIIAAEKPLRYPQGRLRVAYVGTTIKGIARIAHSAAYCADAILGRHGIRKFDIHVVNAGKRRGAKTWLKLERALLIVFREKYGTPPVCNIQGKGITPGKEFEYFTRGRLAKLLEAIA